MQDVRTSAQEAVEDIFFGQVVIIWARWFIILAGAVLVLWTATSVGELTGAILGVLVLMAINFLVHGRYFLERPANKVFLIAVSLLDLIVITAIVLVWHGQAGLSSPFFVFYYPILLAFAFVFPRGVTARYTALALAAYVGACLIADGSLVGNTGELKALVLRLMSLATMGGLGSYYWRIQRDRLRAAVARGAAQSGPGLEHELA